MNTEVRNKINRKRLIARNPLKLRGAKGGVIAHGIRNIFKQRKLLNHSKILLYTEAPVSAWKEKLTSDMK